MSRTRISSLLGKITVLVIICCCSLPAQAKYGGGTGEPNESYLIYTAEQMNEIGLNEDDWDKHFILMADIDLSAFTGTAFNIIGYWVSGDDNKPFTGVFDGNDHIISNFTYTSAGTSYIGLFGYVDDPNAEIKDLGLVDPNVDAGTGLDVGSLVGLLSSGKITNCYVEGGSVSGNWRPGGLVGHNDEGTITNCYSNTSVSGNNYVGGLVGDNGGTITNCYSTASVSGDWFVGGLVGDNQFGTITNRYSTTSVSGNNYVGGLVGDNELGTITNCYSAGSVTGTTAVGGLAGRNHNGTISNCYSTGSVSGYENVGGLVGSGAEWRVADSFWDIQTSGQTISAGGMGKTTAEMQMASTFIAWICCDCPPVWTIDEGQDYPRLLWEDMPGEPIPIPSYGGGSGEPNDPYLIYTAEQFNTIGLIKCIWDKCFKLMSNVDLSEYTGTEFNIIGVYVSYNHPINKPFTGVFDGNGHTISNFTYASTGTSSKGLFRYVKGVIKDLGLIDPDVDAGTGGYVGSLVGYNSGTITGCYVEGGCVSGNDRVGGLVGENYYGTISNCYATGSVSGDDFIGGLVGDNGGTISNSYSEASVSGDRCVGGLVGLNDATISNSYSANSVSGYENVGGLVGVNDEGTITNSYSSGSVAGYENVGGLVGVNSYRGTITNCYSAGSVSGANYVGGLVGRKSGGEVNNSFWDIETSGQTRSAGGTGLTTAEMQMASTFADWVCDPVWTIDEGVDYPRLWWQNMPGEPIATPFYGIGNGTEADPHLIYTADQLNAIGLFPCLWDRHFKLMVDIDLGQFTGEQFNIIGTDYYHPFTGVFDGNNHTISSFIYDSNGLYHIGLFGIVDDPNAEIKNLGLIDPNLDAGTGGYVGSLVGYLNRGTITNCYAEAGSVAGHSVVGGLVGRNYYATITNSHSSGSVSGDKDVGGLVGQNYYGTITNCYSVADVSAIGYVGGLVGHNSHATITNCCSTGSVAGSFYVGGLVGWSYGTITNSYSEGDVSGASDNIGGLVGYNLWGTITNCYSTDSVSGNRYVGGLVGENSRAIITNCCSTGSVSGTTDIGGLVGYNHRIITNCYSTGSVSGTTNVGGLVGYNYLTITDCYSEGDVSGDERVGGLVGYNYLGSISNCYSSGVVSGTTNVGGLVGRKLPGEVNNSFWDIETSGQATSAGGTGKTTAEMQTMSTFTDAGWDFTTPVWTIDEGVDYPRLWWELAPVLHAEPQVTLGISNTIFWDPVPCANDYYAECTADANFTSILSNTGWITETSYEFTGLQLGQRYWYSVKARNSAGVESQWSNVESSLQSTLADAVELMLNPENLKNNNLKNSLLNKIDEVLDMIDEGLYKDALNKLQNDILSKMNGCSETGEPDKNDWIITCEEQNQIYPLIIETIEHVRTLME